MTTNDSARAFDKFLKKPALLTHTGEQSETAPDELPDDGHYRAYKVGTQGRGQRSIRFHTETGVISVMTYSYLTEIVTASHQYLTLVFTNCIIDVIGRNLHVMLDPLQDAKIRAMYCYRSDQYPEPAEGEAVITIIRREALYEARGAREAANSR